MLRCSTLQVKLDSLVSPSITYRWGADIKPSFQNNRVKQPCVKIQNAPRRAWELVGHNQESTKEKIIEQATVKEDTANVS